MRGLPAFGSFTGQRGAMGVPQRADINAVRTGRFFVQSPGEALLPPSVPWLPRQRRADNFALRFFISRSQT